MEKRSGIDTSEDTLGLRQRHGAATLSQGAEQANVENIQGIMDKLIARKPAMAKLCEQQLGELFPGSKNSYGRARAVGMTASEASALVNRAFRK
jgi:hypothetical protein